MFIVRVKDIVSFLYSINRSVFPLYCCYRGSCVIFDVWTQSFLVSYKWCLFYFSCLEIDMLNVLLLERDSNTNQTDLWSKLFQAWQSRIFLYMYITRTVVLKSSRIYGVWRSNRKLLAQFTWKDFFLKKYFRFKNLEKS